MAKGLGSAGGATMERSKLSLKQESKSFEARTDDSGGGGIGGKGIFNGGGGDNDDGDGDDYFDEFGDGDNGGGDEGFFRTVVLAENYSRCVQAQIAGSMLSRNQVLCLGCAFIWVPPRS